MCVFCADRITLADMQRVATLNFMMDTEDPTAPTPFGVPIYMTFSTLIFTVVSARGLLGQVGPLRLRCFLEGWGVTFFYLVCPSLPPLSLPPRSAAHTQPLT